ncbi:TPA: glycosyltransferase [Clostridium perfringens]|nr:glycosyltransferase [Clostridium perfringens]HBI6917951.1 glycosyltransferase [Clostridium perfringens]HBI7037791.1 glycosyltransferase [Clostridium perfringens]
MEINMEKNIKVNIPLVSVIIPVYNAECYLEKCLESIRRQTIFEQLEVIFIDDGSIDKSSEMLDRFSELYKNVIVKHIYNGGVSSARNLGLKIATGQFISFIDSDDYLDKDFFEYLLIEVSEKTDIVSCGFIAEYPDISVDHSSNKKLVLDKKEALREFLLEKNMDPNVTSKIFRKTVIEGLEFDSSLTLAEDRWFLFLCLENISELKSLPGGKYHYVMNDNSACRKEFSSKKFDSIIVAEKITSKIKEQYPEYLELAECSSIDAKCRVYGEIYKSRKSYKNEYNSIKKSIRKFSILKKMRYSSKKHTLAFILAKISPSLYSFIKNNMKLQYKS